MMPERLFLRAFSVSRVLLCSTLYCALSSTVYAGPERLEVTPFRDSGGLKYKVKIVGWDFNDLRRNPLYGCQYHSRNQCSLRIAFISPNSQTMFYSSEFFPKYITEAKTIGDLGRALFSDGQWVNKSFTSPYLHYKENTICVYVGYLINGGFSGGTPLGGSGSDNCAVPEIPPTSCSFSEDIIELSHGSLTEKNVNGNKAYAKTSVKCTSTLDVRIFSKSDTDNLSLGSAITSKVTANGQSLKNGVSLTASASGTPLVLVSQLSASNTKAGKYQTSFDMIVSLP